MDSTVCSIQLEEDSKSAVAELKQELRRQWKTTVDSLSKYDSSQKEVADLGIEVTQLRNKVAALETLLDEQDDVILCN